MTRRRVDLPQPEGPMSETNSPRPMSRLMSLRATTGVPDELVAANDLLIPSR